MSSTETLELFLQYWYLAIGIVGLASNVLMFIVFNGRALRKNSVSIYFRAIAISDIAMNLIFLKYFHSYASKSKFENASVFMCKTTVFVISALSPIPAWFLVTASFNRFITIVFPMKFALLKKAQFARILITFILIFNMAIYAFLFVNANLLKNSSSISSNVSKQNNMTSWNETLAYCDVDKESTGVFLILDFVNTTVAPFTILLASTVATLIGVQLVHKRAQKYRGSSSKSKSHHHHHHQVRDLKFAITMIILNVVFLVFKIPKFLVFIGNVFNLLNYLDEDQLVKIKYVYEILLSLFYTIDFPLQLATNSLVRNQFLMLFQKNAKLVKNFRSEFLTNHSLNR